jgi:hypothetical protein
MAGQGGRAGFGRITSASQSGTTGARAAAARLLIRARLPSSLIAALSLFIFLPNGQW